MIAKKVKTYVSYVSPRNLAFPRGKFIVPWGHWVFTSGNSHVLGEKEFKLPWGTT